MAAETNTGTTPTPQGSAPRPGGLTKKQGLRTLQRKLERMELEHLRQHSLELHGRLERAEAELERATEIADFWQRHAHDLQLALLDEDFATHRCVGINKGGELMVVKTTGGV